MHFLYANATMSNESMIKNQNSKKTYNKNYYKRDYNNNKHVQFDLVESGARMLMP